MFWAVGQSEPGLGDSRAVRAWTWGPTEPGLGAVGHSKLVQYNKKLMDFI